MTERGAGHRATVNVTATLLFAIFAICFVTSCNNSMEQASASQERQSPVVAAQELTAIQEQTAATDEEEQPKGDGQIPVEQTSTSQERNMPTPAAEQDLAESRLEPVETNENGQPQLGAGGLPITRVGPPPTIFELGWEADKSLIAPGEPITITLELKNVWDRPVVFSEFPMAITLTQVDTRVGESIPWKLRSGKSTPGPMLPGEEVIFVAAVSPSVSAGLQPDRYRVGVNIRYSRHLGRPELGQTKSGMSSDIIFVVTPPEGVLNMTMLVGQVREWNGAKITLDSIQFTPEGTTIVALAEPITNGSAVSKPAPATTPTAVVSSQGTPSPAPAVGQLDWDGDLTELRAFYRSDGSALRSLTNHLHWETPDGVHHEWSFDPVSANAETLEFAIAPGVLPGRDGTFAYPTDDGTSPWEWTVPLRGIEKRQETRLIQTGMEHPRLWGGHSHKSQQAAHRRGKPFYR